MLCELTEIGSRKCLGARRTCITDSLPSAISKAVWPTFSLRKKKLTDGILLFGKSSELIVLNFNELQSFLFHHHSQRSPENF